MLQPFERAVLRAKLVTSNLEAFAFSNVVINLGARALSFSAFVVKITHCGENRVQKFLFSAEKS